LRRARADADTDCDCKSHSDTDRHRRAGTDRDSNSQPDAEPDGDTKPDAIAHADSVADADRDCRAGADTDAYSQSNVDGFPNACSDLDAGSDSRANSDSKPDSDGEPIADGYASDDRRSTTADRDADGNCEPYSDSQSDSDTSADGESESDSSSAGCGNDVLGRSASERRWIERTVAGEHRRGRGRVAVRRARDADVPGGDRRADAGRGLGGCLDAEAGTLALGDRTARGQTVASSAPRWAGVRRSPSRRRRGGCVRPRCRGRRDRRLAFHVRRSVRQRRGRYRRIPRGRARVDMDGASGAAW
jgi:hypothetical protein